MMMMMMTSALSRSIDGIGRVEHTCAVGDDEYVRWHQRLVMIRYWWRPGPGAGVPGSVGGIGVAVNDSFGSCEIEWYLALARWFLAYHPATPPPPKKRERLVEQERACACPRVPTESETARTSTTQQPRKQASKQPERYGRACACACVRELSTKQIQSTECFRVRRRLSTAPIAHKNLKTPPSTSAAYRATNGPLPSLPPLASAQR